MVGISGAIGARLEWQKAMILSLPARCSGSVVLKVSKTAGQVAEVSLAIAGVTGIVRGTVRVAGGAAERMIAKYYAKDAEIMADLNKVKWVPQPKGSVAGAVKPGTSSGAETGWHKL